MTNISVPKESAARRRMFLALGEAQERFAHELMNEEERLVLRERIISLKTKVARTAS